MVDSIKINQIHLKAPLSTPLQVLKARSINYWPIKQSERTDLILCHSIHSLTHFLPFDPVNLHSSCGRKWNNMLLLPERLRVSLLNENNSSNATAAPIRSRTLLYFNGQSVQIPPIPPPLSFRIKNRAIVCISQI